MKFKKVIINLIIFFIVCAVFNFSLATDINEVEEQTNIPQEEQQEETPKQEEPEQQQEEPKQEPQEEQPKEEQPQEEPKQEPQEEQPKEQEPEQQKIEEPSSYTNQVYNVPNENSSKSSNANLASMNIKVGFLSPEFNKNTTEYELIVDLSVDNIEIDAKTEDENANLYISGNTDLEEGENKISIVVTAEDGTEKIYKINAIKTDNVEHINAKLKVLNVKNYSLYPSFKSNIYNYSLNISEKIEKLEILSETENENATIKIEGNENLQEGENIIKVIVTAEDGQTSREYKINVFISTKDINKKEQNILEPIIILGILLATACGVVILLINKK